jgi:hypothetical protein
MIYRFRIILDTQEDVFRDIEIESDATLEDFHNVITQSFGFGGQEMASFYISNELWEQGEEIALFDMSDGQESIKIMGETPIEEVTDKERTKMIYVYDFLNLWTFLVELADIVDYEDGRTYPNLMFSHGEIPDEAPEKEFLTEDIESEDSEIDSEDFEDLEFDENWN